MNEHREIVYEIGNCLSVAFENMEYILLNREGIAKAWVRKVYVEREVFGTILDKYYSKSIYDYNVYVDHLKKIDCIQLLLSKAKSKPAFYNGVMGYFLQMSPSLRGFRLIQLDDRKAVELETHFFTPKGLETIFKARPISSLKFKKEATMNESEIIEAFNKDEQFMYRLIIDKIINAIEVQYAILKYVDSASKYLHMSSDHFGRNIRSVFNKDSW
ncbi:hypothetical protein [Paenibacillus rigui]|uniref:Uncharacterized protein n=1 Tax=Paenibacillus rigui TaxID=554312 RepID=A0A229UGL0_9BACL|nr:hypothetical protein [Paenibacillus rigui]OXM82528.1 hypothetical protein CF651_30555 [Paenibacillus rigui]